MAAWGRRVRAAWGRRGGGVEAAWRRRYGGVGWRGRCVEAAWRRRGGGVQVRGGRIQRRGGGVEAACICVWAAWAVGGVKVRGIGIQWSRGAVESAWGPTGDCVGAARRLRVGPAYRGVRAAWRLHLNGRGMYLSYFVLVDALVFVLGDERLIWYLCRY